MKDGDSIPPSFKRLGSGDVKWLRDLNLIFATAFEDEESHLSKPPTDQYLEELLGQKSFFAFVAYKDQEVCAGIVGYILDKYEQQRRELYIYDLAVKTTFQNKGIGFKLIQEAQILAHSLGIYLLFVQALSGDLPATKLYRRFSNEKDVLYFEFSSRAGLQEFK